MPFEMQRSLIDFVTSHKHSPMNKKQFTQLAYEITGKAIKVHKELGPGLLEKIYEVCLQFELIKSGYHVQNQFKVPVIYGGIEMDMDLKADLLVNDCVVVEIKVVESIMPVHEAQLFTYMRLLKKPQGLLINFFTDNITRSMKPLVNQYFQELED
jgi:GxxExxY protein